MAEKQTSDFQPLINLCARELTAFGGRAESAVRYILHDITIVDVGVLIGWPSARCRAVPCAVVPPSDRRTFFGV